MTHGGSIPGCEFSLPGHFHDGPCPEWQPCSWTQVMGEFPRAGRGTGPGLGAELGNIPHFHAEWLRAVSGAPSSVLVLPAFLHHHPPPPPSAECGDLCSPPVQASCPCALFFPENCQLFIPPSGLCRPGGSCLLTSLAAFLGLLRSGLAGWSPSLRCTLPGHVLVTPLLLLFCTLRSFYE